MKTSKMIMDSGVETKDLAKKMGCCNGRPSGSK